MKGMGKIRFPAVTPPPKVNAIILPSKSSSEPCPDGWEMLQADELFVVYTETNPTVHLGYARSLVEAMAIVRNVNKPK